MKKIHINCDLGEGGEHDGQLMPLISACNIACGGHAGTLETMQHTVDLAMENGVEIGAHPSYPDKENFGRISIPMESEELKRSLVAQIMSLKQIAEAEGAVLTHVKPHGALYNDAFNNVEVAKIIIDSVLEFGNDLVLYVAEGSVISELAKGKLEIRYEAFADRNYNPDGSLVNRKETGAVITQKEEVFNHLLSMISEQKITPQKGQKFDTFATTFCLHGDTPNSVEILEYLHRELPAKNIEIFKA
ncbi:5-oxoprolinase subunit PxpA [Salinimicrobium sp. MT39]|uniref:5-oxoprolinase subunit PxpA n=1 Tax=Salinimicrobium profundisediminis TaxID=2994553 RepID=A0A9X3I233_9FLAO|nr:5-oxoprolinase subunit PxpA [Salinimicrobium profundisediminis]MCX2839705.1 5-oxoprolinase subunit PxpA [Salinimicrobium profundisediminis]